MKKIILLPIITFLAINCKAQQLYPHTVPLEEMVKTADIEDGMYFKDVNHILDKFEGTWTGTANNRTYKIKLNQTAEEYDIGEKIKRDLLFFYYKIKEDNEELIDVLDAEDDDKLIGMGSRLYVEEDNSVIYVISYTGEESICGQTGHILLKTTDNPDEIRFVYYPKGGLVFMEDCPDGVAEQLFPNEEEMLLTKEE